MLLKHMLKNDKARYREAVINVFFNVVSPACQLHVEEKTLKRKIAILQQVAT